MQEKILNEKQAEERLNVDIGDVPRGTSAPYVLTAEIDSTPQKLRTLRSYVKAIATIPAFLPTEATAVLKLLFDCFMKQGSVQEGLIGDLIWGFSQSECLFVNGRHIHAPPEFTYNGLVQLWRLGYIKFQSPDHDFVSPESSKLESAWVRYEPKLLEMVYA